MTYHLFYKNLDKLARETFPGLNSLSDLGWDYLISPLELKLPRRVFDEAQAAIRAFDRVSRRTEFVARTEMPPDIERAGADHRSVLMAYDFHTDESGRCYLVEINTNASGFLLSSLAEMVHRSETIENYAPLSMLKDSFAKDYRLFGGKSSAPYVAIADEDVAQQKMFREFVMYRDLFARWGWKSGISDSKDLSMQGDRLLDRDGNAVDFVYNRATDFYLENPIHSALREAYLQKAACFSPNPREYGLLADKQRLIQFGEEGFLESVGASAEDASAIRQVLIPTFEKSAVGSEDEIWAKRRSLFFKPKRSYGGKSVYRGESVSRRVFERLMSEDILIQHFQPAQKVPTDDPRSVLNNWKFDVRFYVYENQIQLVIARIYQGQVTNFHSALGGFTYVEFSN